MYVYIHNILINKHMCFKYIHMCLNGNHSLLPVMLKVCVCVYLHIWIKYTRKHMHTQCHPLATGCAQGVCVCVYIHDICKIHVHPQLVYRPGVGWSARVALRVVWHPLLDAIYLYMCWMVRTCCVACCLSSLLDAMFLVFKIEEYAWTMW